MEGLRGDGAPRLDRREAPAHGLRPGRGLRSDRARLGSGGAERGALWAGAATYASGLLVPSARGDFLILKALRESGGTALAVTDDEMREAVLEMGRWEGIHAAPEGGATLAALHTLVRSGKIGKSETVVLFNTGTGLKYPPPA